MSLIDRVKNILKEAPERTPDKPSGLDFEGQSKKFVKNEKNKKKIMRKLEPKGSKQGELNLGNTLIRSIGDGFRRANSSILDGHVTTLISCLVLFLVGTSFVKGFAATLGLGVLISLFTSLNCSKTFLRFINSYQFMRRKNFYLKEVTITSSENLINKS